jgi:hypothetical protein
MIMSQRYRTRSGCVRVGSRKMGTNGRSYRALLRGWFFLPNVKDSVTLTNNNIYYCQCWRASDTVIAPTAMPSRLVRFPGR